MSELTEGVLRKDRRVLILAKEMGGAAALELEPLAGNKDAEVRELAVMCLDASGGPGVGPVFVKGLLDQDLMVQVVSARGLNHHSDASDVPGMVAAYTNVGDSGIRARDTALAIGATGKGLDELRVAKGLEKEETATEGCVVALAKLGDELSQVDFTERWFASKGPARGQYFDYARYIGQKWLLKPLLRFLDDTTPAYRIGVDAIPSRPHYARSCDAAVKLISELTGKMFGFMETGGPNYTESQIAEAREYVKGLGM